MKALVLLVILFQAPVFADQGGFVSAPDLTQIMEYPYEVNPEWPTNLIDIDVITYKRNTEASFCMRPPEMIDTIVIHHSETAPTATPEYINQLHLERGTAADPWYMIAYTYVINSPYGDATVPESKVTEGRPIDIVGAHAGTNVFVAMDDEQLKMWNEKKILCGKENEVPKFDATLVKGGKIKANVTTLGIVVNGNYSPFSATNPSGYSKKNPRYPTLKTQDMFARLSCQLQKKYPKMKNIKWHSYYHSTSCPGTIKSYIGQIKALAKGYGCTFN